MAASEVEQHQEMFSRIQQLGDQNLAGRWAISVTPAARYVSENPFGDWSSRVFPKVEWLADGASCDLFDCTQFSEPGLRVFLLEQVQPLQWRTVVAEVPSEPALPNHLMIVGIGRTDSFRNAGKQMLTEMQREVERVSYDNELDVCATSFEL